MFKKWVELCLSKKDLLKVLNPSILECDLETGLHRSNQVKIRSVGWALIQYDWCPYKKQKFEHIKGK